MPTCIPQILKIMRNRVNIQLYSMWPKVLPHVKKNPYIINQNHIFSKKNCEVIFGQNLTNFTPKHSELSVESQKGLSIGQYCLCMLVVLIDIFVIKLFSYDLKDQTFILQAPASTTPIITVDTTRVLVLVSLQCLHCPQSNNKRFHSLFS